MRTEVQKIVESINAFNKDLYYKNEILPELFKLQLQVSAIAYDKDEKSLEKESPKIYEVVEFLKAENKLFGNVADRQLKQFEKESAKLCNRIKNESSGIRGEKRLFEQLDSMPYSDGVMKNVEIFDEDMGSTEFDAVMIMKNGILIVEAKNTAKNVYVNSNGGFYTCGTYERKNFNIEDKMIRKQKILSKVLEKAGIYNIEIKSCVVLTNEKKDLKASNSNARVKVCLLGMLEYYVEQLEKQNPTLSSEQINSIYKAIDMARCERQYPFMDFDAQRYKNNFAELMVILNEKKRERYIEQEQSMLQQTQYYDQPQQPMSQQQYYDQPQQPMSQQQQYYDQPQQSMSQQSQYYDQMQQPTQLQPEVWNGLQPQSTVSKCFDVIQSTFEAGIEVLPTVLKHTIDIAIMGACLSYPIARIFSKKETLF